MRVLSCVQRGVWFGRCKYEARYDLTPPVNGDFQVKMGPTDLCRLIDFMTTKTYVRDICVRCGNVIERPIP